MKPTTSTYKQILASGNTRKFLVRIEFTLADNTHLVLTEADIMDGSFKYVTASSSTTSFDLGAAVIGMCSFSLENFDERFTQYDFFNATAVVWLKLVGDTEYMRIGFFTVDEPEYAGAIVSLELLDNMWKFDVPLSEAGVGFPCSCRTAVQRMCVYNGVTLATPDFHGADYVISKKPEQDMNCRELLSYIAMITCNFCVIDSEGNLRLRWYTVSDKPADDLDGGTFSTRTTPYSDGDTANGGNFTNYNSGDSYDGGTFLGMAEIPQFTRNFSLTVGTDEITITGAKFTIDNVDYQIGNDGYVLTLENPLVDASNVNAVLNLIWDRLQGFVFRTFSLKTLPDIACEVGDRCIVKDLKGNFIPTSISYLSIGLSSMEAHCDAVSPTRNLTKRYSKAVSQSVEVARRVSEDSISAYDVAVQNMNNLAIHAIGAYQDYEELATGGRVYYLSSKPITKDANGKVWLTDGASAFKTTGEGLFVSQSGATDPDDRTWTNGYNAQTGELIINVLYTIGLHADWIIAGLLKSANFINSEGDYSLAGTMFNIADGVIKSKNFAIDENGIVHIANGAIIGGYATEDELNGYAKESELASGTTIINGGCITTGLIKDAQNTFSLNMTTGDLVMNRGTFKGSINVNNMFLVDGSTGNVNAKSGLIGDLTIANGELYRNGNRMIVDGGATLLNSRKAQTKNLYSFNSVALGIKATTYLKLDYYIDGYPNYVPIIMLQYEYSDGYWSTVASTQPSYYNTWVYDLNFGYLNFTENKNYRLAIDIPANSGRYKIYYRLHVENVTIVSLSDEGIIGTLKGSFSGSLDCQAGGKIGSFVISDDSLQAFASDGSYGSLDNMAGVDISPNGCRFFNSRNGNGGSISSGYEVGVYKESSVLGADVDYVYMGFNTAQNDRPRVYAQVNGTNYSVTFSSSDKRFKHNIKPLDPELSKELIDGTETKSFEYNGQRGTHYGVIAQEARELLDSLGETDAVLEHSMGVDNPNITDPRTIDYHEYIPHLINYVKDLRTEIEELKAEIKALKEDK